MTNNNLTKEQIKSIENYGNEIMSLETFVEAVREMPGMYIGHKGNRGFINMFREVLQNSIDELMRKNSPCDRIMVTYDENTSTIIIEDNGKGIPLGSIVRIFTKQHTSSNYKKELYNYTSGRHGVGAKVTNALSTKFIVESYVLGEARRVEFDEGIVWKKGDKNNELVIPNKDNRQGTMVCFTPSFEIMGDIQCSFDDVLGLIRSLLPLTTIGSKIYFKAITLSGKEVNMTIVNTDGVLTYLIDNVLAPIIKPIMYDLDTGHMRASVAFTYDADNVTMTEQIVSFANFCPTDTKESSHVKGFITGIRRYFVNYMNKIYLTNTTSKAKNKKKKPLTVNESDIRNGLRAAIDVAHLNPNFTGQAKEVLSNDDMEVFVRDLTMESLDRWSKDNPKELQKLCKYFKEIAEIRSKVDEGKVKLSNQYQSAPGGKPAKYTEPRLMGKAKPSDKVKFELFLVEGDSAGGSAKNNRVNDTQGIFPLRGKILNCFKETEQRCLQNAEIAGMIDIIGGGYGKNFDINKVPWDKVIATPDADADGSHINALILRFVLRFCPGLIESGKFYTSVAPLFGMKKGKETVYFTSRVDYVQFIQKEFSKKYKISTLKDGKPLTASQVVDLLYKNIDYTYELRKIGDRYKIEHKLLELYLFNRNESVATIGKLIKKEFRFMEIKSINETPTAEGIINDQYNTLFMNKRLIEDSARIIEIIDSNLYKDYRLNDIPSSIYDIMMAYEKSEPSSIERYKGLGQMEPDELGISTILPGDRGQRVLIRYTMEDAIKEINQIRALESDKSKLLENLEHLTRTDILN